jgi:hypothetical protein
MDLIGQYKSYDEQSAVKEPMKVDTPLQTTVKEQTSKRDNIWYANCICLADILDSDHDLSRRPGDENPLETYWNKYASLGGNDELKNAYTQIFSDGKKPRTQPKIHKMFVELINKFGPKFQDIDGPSEVPRIALSIRNITCDKKIAGQRTKINTDSELTKLVVETHRGGSYDQKNSTPAELFKYVPSTIFDNGSNVDFLPFDPSNNYTFSNNYFPYSNTRMTTKANMLNNVTDLSETEFLSVVMQSETAKNWAPKQQLLIHTFRGKDGPTYSVQWGQVTADEVTFELFGQNRRSWCSTIKKVRNMIISLPEEPADQYDVLARKCHILFGKTCGDGVSIDAAEQMKCGVLSNDICCCYRAAIVNGFGYRACPTTDKLFSTTRNLEVFQTKPRGKFDIIKAKENVDKLLISLKDIESAKKERIDYISTFSIKASDGKNILYVAELYAKKKEFLIGLVNSKQIPEDLKPFIPRTNSTNVPTVPEDLLKRYSYYDMDQCLGSKDFYKIELDQFIVDIKSNIDQLKKIRIASRSTDKNDTFGESLTILANIEVILSSFIMKQDDSTEEMVPDKAKILEYSNLFFKSNLEKYNGSRFLTKFKEALETTAQKGTQQVKDLLKYISYFGGNGGGDQTGGEGEPILLMSFLVPMPYSYDEVDHKLIPWSGIKQWKGKYEIRTDDNTYADKKNTKGDIIEMFDIITENDIPLRLLPSVSGTAPVKPSTKYYSLIQNNENIPSAIAAFGDKRKRPSSSSSSSTQKTKRQKRNSRSKNLVHKNDKPPSQRNTKKKTHYSTKKTHYSTKKTKEFKHFTRRMKSLLKR